MCARLTMNSALLDVNLLYYWIRRGVGRHHAVVVRAMSTSLRVEHRTLVVFADFPEFNVEVDDMWQFPQLAMALRRLLKRPKVWARREVVGGQLALRDNLEDGPVPLLGERLLECFQ